jgi:hypothetical protein
MMTAAEAVRAWVNGPSGLSGDGPVSRGAYLQSQASPADGAYAVLEQQPGPGEAPVAEPSPLQVARGSALVYAGTSEAAGQAAGAYADAVRGLEGCPVAMGDAMCLAHANLAGPSYVPQPGGSGEQFCFQVVADFLLTAEGN